ncbi:hypothetical protein [uncultured Aquimonas sp.]|uniref:hypothetical protein n=1 Tax=uncultured Aquimonas sp. TaxID=385483 RepID=UPI00086EC7B6|nr:hypothetical protein [uncultured Aquimonas sp.]ODU46282.1 MAG: hypothetical protein ABS96_10315 [Xanthomonadaceae bacterium SCN 69-123]
MTTLCLCDVNEHDLQVFAEIAAAGRRPAQADRSAVDAEGRVDALAPQASRPLPVAAGAQA